MQAIFRHHLYNAGMNSIGSHLRELREDAGLSLRELARQLEVHPSNVSFWENQDKLPSSSILLKMAESLGVTVEELLGGKPRKENPARGRLAKLFAEASALPKNKQERISIVLEDMLTAQKAKAS